MTKMHRPLNFFHSYQEAEKYLSAAVRMFESLSSMISSLSGNGSHITDDFLL